jgi:hypothetical protein
MARLVTDSLTDAAKSRDGGISVAREISGPSPFFLMTAAMRMGNTRHGLFQRRATQTRRSLQPWQEESAARGCTMALARVGV